MKNTIINKSYYRIDSDTKQMGKYFPQLEYTSCSNYEKINCLVNLTPDNLIINTTSKLKLKFGCKKTDMLSFGSRYYIFSNKLKSVFSKYKSTNIFWIPVDVDFSNSVEKLNVFYHNQLSNKEDIIDFNLTTFKILDIDLDIIKKDLFLDPSNPVNSMNEIRSKMGKFDVLRIDKIFLKVNGIHILDLFPFESVNSVIVSSELKNEIEELKLSGIQFHKQEVNLIC